MKPIFVHPVTALSHYVMITRCAMDSKAEMGYCSRTCPNLYIYMVVLAIIKLIVSTSTIGNFIIDIR